MKHLKKTLCIAVILQICHVTLFSEFVLEKEEIKRLHNIGEQVTRNDVTNFFNPTSGPFKTERIINNIKALRKAAKESLKKLQEVNVTNKKIAKPQPFNAKIANYNQVKKTLKFIITSIDQDLKNKKRFRILDPMLFSI